MFSTSSSAVGSAANSRGPTPVSKPPKVPFVTRFFKSCATFYTALGLTVVFLLIMANWYHVIPVTYCDHGAVSEVDCVPCPVNALCENGYKRCVDGAKEVMGVCVAPGTDEEWALKNSARVMEAVLSRNLNVVTQLKKLPEFKEYKTSRLVQAIDFSGTHMVRDEVIVRRLSEKIMKEAFVVGFVTTLTVLVTSLVMRLR